MVSMTPQTQYWKVQWKFPKMKMETAQYEADSIYNLLRMLNRAEGVNRTNVDVLIVHQILTNGDVIEHLAVDNYKRDADAASNVVNLLDRIKANPPKKPHVRVVSEPVEHRPGRVVMGYQCVAYPARNKEATV